jgi:hypothetical protein
MALAHKLSRVSFTQMRILTSAKVCLAHVEDEYKIAYLRLNADANVSDIPVEKFAECKNFNWQAFDNKYDEQY